MNKENNQNNNTILNAFSIQEITSLFAVIDEKILSLHQCSSQDFMSLNAYFKKYYKDSKVISQNASDILNVFTDQDKKNEIFRNLSEFNQKLSEHLINFDFVTGILIQGFEKVVQEIEHMFVPSNNLKQDLMTLKLLVANLKIDITISTESFGMMRKKTNDFNEIISQTKSFLSEFYTNVNQLKTQLKQNLGSVTEMNEKNRFNIGNILNEVENCSNLFNLKYEEAQELVPQLKQSTESTAANIGKIITNLQYHDIIRQKIEHIQQTHQDILKELSSVMSGNGDELNQQLQLKCFVQIRDVAGLQAAQLIHTNKEYQKAIEVISEKFLQVGNEMTVISGMSNKFINSSNSTSVSHFKDIVSKLNETEQVLKYYEGSLKIIKDLFFQTKVQFEETLNIYNELSDFISTLEKNILKSINNQNFQEDENKTIGNIKELLTECRSIISQHQVLFENIKVLHLNAEEKCGKQFSCDNCLNDLYFLSQRINLFLNDSNQKVYITLEENQKLSQQVSDDIKSSLEQIQYYDFFDKTIEEIIYQLNEINFKLQNLEIMDEEHKRQNLEHLKSKYTMQSEHIIHESISGEKNISQDEIVSIDSTGAEEDDDNLELF